MREIFELYAIRYATRGNRLSSETFITNALNLEKEVREQPIDYYFWVARSDSKTIVIDTGFSRKEAAIRKKETDGTWDPHIFCDATEGLQMLGIDAKQVTDVVLTHLHFDHASSLAAFPAARFHIQEREMRHVTGPQMKYGFLKAAYSPEHVKQLIDLLYANRIVFHDGESSLVPGIKLHLLPGHTPGLQGVEVTTKRGQVLLASDSSHYYANFQNDAPFPILTSATDMFLSFEKLFKIAESPNHIIPGHDPLVGQRYKPLSRDTKDVVFVLHEDEIAA